MMAKLLLNLLRIALNEAQRRRSVDRSAMVLIATVLACQAGCSVCQQARRTILQEPSEFSWRYDRGRSVKAYRQWADEAWEMESGACPELVGADDYALGFRDGFVDYVYAGGAGEPPPVPPRKFWNVAWRTPAGAAGAEQWFAGYRHGAQTARNGGYRQNGVLQSSYLESGGPWIEGELPTTPMPEEVGAPAESLPEPSDAGTHEELMLPEPPTPPADDGEAPLDDQSDEDPADAIPADELPPVEMPEAAEELDSSSAALRPISASQRFRRALSGVRSHETSNPQ